MSRIGVIVLTHNRRADVTRTLERMLVVPDDAHVVVVDNGSTDGTAPALRRRFPGLAVIRLSRNRGAAGRNAAVAQLDCEYVAFCDDDTWWAAGSLTRAADLLDARTVVYREIAYLANAHAADPIDVHVDAWIENPFLGDHPAPTLAPVRLLLNYEMRRLSDGEKMLVSTAEKVVTGRTLLDSGLLDRLRDLAR